jgi:hypothetical protein
MVDKDNCPDVVLSDAEEIRKKTSVDKLVIENAPNTNCLIRAEVNDIEQGTFFDLLDTIDSVLSGEQDCIKPFYNAVEPCIVRIEYQ